MAFELSALPYPKNALEPHVSAETLDYHHGKHHAGYVRKLNAAVEKSVDLQGLTLTQIIQVTPNGTGVFNNAAQVFNHEFYWQSMSPTGGGSATGAIGAAIKRDFGSFESFQEEFEKAGTGQFGSGWVWLVHDENGLSILATANADTPIARPGLTPILVCDVWEHAYYIDYRNLRAKYLKSFWRLINWNFANDNLAQISQG